MNDSEFDRLIKAKLERHETEVPEFLWNAIATHIPQKRISPFIRIVRYSAAATIAALFSVTSILLVNESKQQQQATRVLAEQIKQEQSSLPLIISAPHIPASLANNINATQRSAATENTPSQTTADTSTVFIAPIPDSPIELAENHIDHTPAAPASVVTVKKKTSMDAPQIDIQKNKKFHRKYAVSVLADGALALNRSTTVSTPVQEAPMPQSASLTRSTEMKQTELKYSHAMPLAFGITAEKTLNSYLGIESGAIYTYLSSTFSGNNISGKQELHYIGIPLNLIYRFAHWGNASFYASAGTQADFLVYGSAKSKIKEGETEQNSFVKYNHDEVQMSVHAKVGASYRFYKRIEIYAEPNVGYYFDNKSSVQSIWNHKSVNFGLSMGLRNSF